MSSQALITAPHSREPSLQVLGVSVTVLANNTKSSSYGVTLQEGEAGMGPPPHSHVWDESFYVLEGSVEFTSNGVAKKLPNRDANTCTRWNYTWVSVWL